MAGDGGSWPGDRARTRLLVAVLLEGPVAHEVTGLRRALTGAEGHLAPHVTLVPPVNVAEAARPEALALVREAAAEAAPLSLALGPPAFFDRPRAVLYLAVGGDVDGLEALRRKVARAPLDRPAARPPRPFVPHVTLARGGGPAEAAERAALLGAYRALFTCRSIQLLEERQAAGGRRWCTVSSEVLGGRAVRGRGGFEIDVQLADRLDPEVAAALEQEREADERAAGPDGPGRRPFAFAARRHGALVGGATGVIDAGSCELDVLVVLATERGLGAGSRLLEAVTRLAAEAACAHVRARVPVASPGAAFLTRRGFRVVATLAGPRGGPDEAVLERTLG